MSNATILVRPGFDINLEHLKIFGEKFAEVARELAQTKKAS